MYSVEQIVDVLKLASNVVGLTYDIKINSGIFEHCDGFLDEEVDVTKDIYEIKASIDDPITINKILNTFEEIKSQFETIEDSGRSYFYEGISKRNNMWKLSWGS